jgi:predicted nucleic acid-binding protein
LIIADTSGLVAAFGRNAPRHSQVAAALAADPGPIVISPYVLAELDYMLLQRYGTNTELEFLGEVAAGAFELAPFGRTDLARAVTLLQKYRDIPVGLADASLVVLAERYDTTRLLTLDERHFRAIRPLHADAFTLLPADSPLTGPG